MRKDWLDDPVIFNTPAWWLLMLIILLEGFVVWGVFYFIVLLFQKFVLG